MVGVADLFDGAGRGSGGWDELVQGVAHCGNAQSASRCGQLGALEHLSARRLTCGRHMKRLVTPHMVHPLVSLRSSST